MAGVLARIFRVESPLSFSVGAHLLVRWWATRTKGSWGPLRLFVWGSVNITISLARRGRGIEVCCRPTLEIIKKLCESSAHRHEESHSVMLRRGCYMATQNVRIPAGLLPRLTYDKLQLSCPELPSRCVTRAHLASAVGCDISPPAKKILLLCLKTPPGALSLCSLNLLTQNGFWNCWTDRGGVIEFE